MSLLELTENGLYYRPADVFIDPHRPVPKALITHAHADHARRGCSQYLCAEPGVEILKARVYSDQVSGIKYGETLRIGEALVSFHPAGHILGSSQIRLEHRGHISVVSGDYKIEADRSCHPFEPVSCHHLVTECTFGLPVYVWDKSNIIFEQINRWWQHNISEGRTSIISAYALGKAQRILAGINPEIGPIAVHTLNRRFIPMYKPYISLPKTYPLTMEYAHSLRGKALVICPSSIIGTKLIDTLKPYSLAAASGWMQIKGAAKSRGYDRGFVLSDHADWPGLINAVNSSGAEQVWTTHGFSKPFAKALREKGLNADVLSFSSHETDNQQSD